MATRVQLAAPEAGADVRGNRVRRRDFRCSACGYGVALAGPPPPCPMCRATEWEPAPWRPFTRRADAVTARRTFPSHLGL
jgi:hypothetical protein